MDRKLPTFCVRVVRIVRRNTRRLLKKTYNSFTPTYTQSSQAVPLAKIFTFIDEAFIRDLSDEFPQYPSLVREQAENAVSHIFDLLGSGPQVVKHGIRCPGFNEITYPRIPEVNADSSGDWLEGRINAANLTVSKEIWSLINPEYVPMDWQLDFKCGYRWSEKTWHQDIKIGTAAGADIKVPWELSRMQHLPHLALAVHFSEAGVEGFLESEKYFLELRNQILDFVSTNPPGYGVNWACTMDVAIRTLNLLIARDIALASGKTFDAAFEKVFSNSIHDHLKHIVANLEWDERYRGNHYLANIVGLLFGSVYLQSDKQIDAWLSFSVQELIAECNHQFNSDGSNFEGSVCYHRLSTEMLLWSFALLLNLPAEKASALKHHQRHPDLPRLKHAPFGFHKAPGSSQESPLPVACWELLQKAAAFTIALTRPDKLVVQFGDNDSGRLVTLGSGEQMRANGDPSSPLWSLDHNGLVAGIYSLIGVPANSAIDWDPSAKFLGALAGCNTKKLQPDARPPNCDAGSDDVIWEEILNRFKACTSTSKWTSNFSSGSSGLLKDLKYEAFPGFGCYVVSGPNLYLAIRCGSIGLSGLGAHDHCDQLGMELVIEKRSVIRDPGTMVYTASPELRNTYRSASAHFVPRVTGREPADLTKGIFDLRSAKSGECLYFGPKGFIGRHSGYGGYVYRIIVLENESITINDFAEDNLPLTDPTPTPLAFSQGYGRTL